MNLMKPFIHEDIHAWESIPGIFMLSDETLKSLRTFRSIDEMVDYLFVYNRKDAAIALNEHKRQKS